LQRRVGVLQKFDEVGVALNSPPGVALGFVEFAEAAVGAGDLVDAIGQTANVTGERSLVPEDHGVGLLELVKRAREAHE
jgi:hypothetical protein